MHLTIVNTKGCCKMKGVGGFPLIVLRTIRDTKLSDSRDYWPTEYLAINVDERHEIDAQSLISGLS